MKHTTTMKKANRSTAFVFAGAVVLPAASACSDRAADDKAKAAAVAVDLVYAVSAAR
jgi:hypothetical protein